MITLVYSEYQSSHWFGPVRAVVSSVKRGSAFSIMMYSSIGGMS